MLATHSWKRQIKPRVITLIALAITIFFTVVACSGSGQNSEGSLSPETVVDYIHTVAEADRTSYTKHVVNRSKTLEGKPKADGVLGVEATENWKDTNGIPLPAQMFRMGAELASEDGQFSYGLISPWNINDSQAPKGEFEEVGMQKVVETNEPYKDYQEIGGQRYYSAIYPDVAVAEACVSCHNSHPVHQARYPDKQFQLNDVMGGIVINLPLKDA